MWREIKTVEELNKINVNSVQPLPNGGYLVYEIQKKTPKEVDKKSYTKVVPELGKIKTELAKNRVVDYVKNNIKVPNTSAGEVIKKHLNTIANLAIEMNQDTAKKVDKALSKIS